MRGVPGRVPAERHEDHRDVEVLPSLPEVRHEVVLTGSGLAACCGFGARVHVREQIAEGGRANMSVYTTYYVDFLLIGTCGAVEWAELGDGAGPVSRGCGSVSQPSSVFLTV